LLRVWRPAAFLAEGLKNGGLPCSGIEGWLHSLLRVWRLAAFLAQGLKAACPPRATRDWLLFKLMWGSELEVWQMAALLPPSLLNVCLLVRGWRLSVLPDQRLWASCPCCSVAVGKLSLLLQWLEAGCPTGSDDVGWIDILGGHDK
jgi:hypothetical protein